MSKMDPKADSVFASAELEAWMLDKTYGEYLAMYDDKLGKCVDEQYFNELIKITNEYYTRLTGLQPE